MRPHPVSIRFSRDQLQRLDELAEQMTRTTGERWTRHGVLRLCSLAGLDALLEHNLGGGGADI